MVIKMIDWYKLGVWILCGIFSVSCWYYGYQFGGWLITRVFG